MHQRFLTQMKNNIFNDNKEGTHTLRILTTTTEHRNI
jgi:hypothetical protein